MRVFCASRYYHANPSVALCELDVFPVQLLHLSPSGDSITAVVDHVIGDREALLAAMQILIKFNEWLHEFNGLIVLFYVPVVCDQIRQRRKCCRVFSAELIWRDAEVLGKLASIAQIAVDSVGRVVANLHVFAHALL